MKYLEFWNPDSGVVGGFICGLVIIITMIFLVPIVIATAKWWFNKFNL